MSAPALAALAFLLAACRAAPAEPSYRFAAGHELVVAGERIPIDAPVVLWTMEPRYDAWIRGLSDVCPSTHAHAFGITFETAP